MSVPIYALRPTDVYASLETSPQGLTAAEAEARLALYGRNVLAEPPAVPRWRKLVGYVTHPMALLLWAASVLTIISGRPLLGVIIGGVVIVNGAFSYWGEYRAEKAVGALKQLLAVVCARAARRRRSDAADQRTRARRRADPRRRRQRPRRCAPDRRIRAAHQQLHPHRRSAARAQIGRRLAA